MRLPGSLSAWRTRVATLVAGVILSGCTGLRAGGGRHHYLFSYFEGNGDGLHLAYSTDGLRWRELNGDRPFLVPEVGRERLMRDPMVLRGPDGRFRMVWTTGWGLARPDGQDHGVRGIGYASSPDLIHWSAQQYIPVMEHEPTARNAWAPELFYDGAAGGYLLFWSTTIPGRFPATDGQLRKGRSWDPGWDHRIFYTTTRDFRSFAPTRLLYDPGFNVIDATMVRDGRRFLMFVKDETDQPFAPRKNVRSALASSPRGPWGPASPPITGKEWAEGPTALRIGGRWYVYFDRYLDGRFGLVVSDDLVHWIDASDHLSTPPGMRHGTAFEVPASVAESLLAREEKAGNRRRERSRPTASLTGGPRHSTDGAGPSFFTQRACCRSQRRAMGTVRKSTGLASWFSQ